MPRGALLFAENAQYMLSTQDVAFGPSTAKISKIAEYSYTSDIPPLETGVSLMFHTESATYSKVFEMAIPNADGGRPQVADITRIIPEFIPPNIKWSAANANNNQVFFGTGDKNVYNFSFFNVGNERSMSGWTQWIFNHSVRFMNYFQDRAYIVQYNPDNNSYFLPQMDVLDNPGTSTINAAGREFTPRLDCLLNKDQLVATETADDVTYTVPDSIPFVADDLGVRKPLMIVFGNSGDSTYYRELILDEDAGVYTFTLDKEESQEYFSIGLDYRMLVELPSFYVLQDKKADRNNVPIIETVQMHMYLSGRYGGILKRLGYHDQFLDLEAKRADVYLADSNPINELGVTEIPLFCKGDIATVTLTSITPLPSAITGYGWKGHYNNRGVSNLA